jgi:hypothetical protein
MDIKNLINLFRARLFNIKLFGNLRIGLYKEVSIGELIEFIADFRDFCRSRNVQREETGTTAPLPVNSNFNILERLCEQYYVYEDTDKFQKKIIQEVSEIIDELRKDPKTQKDLEAWLNATQDNAVSKFRSDHPKLKEDDIRLFCYISAGFTPTMISVMLKKDKSVVYNRVSRLKAKIK